MSEKYESVDYGGYYRTEFYESFMAETPYGKEQPDDYHDINRISYDDAKKSGAINSDNTHDLGDGCYLSYRPGGSTTAWHENSSGVVDLIVNFSTSSKSWTVSETSRPLGTVSDVFASDLYEKVLNFMRDQPYLLGIRFLSDRILSDSGLRIWQRLFNAGHVLKIYDSEAKININVNSVGELEKYLSHTDKSYGKYQYVLLEKSRSSDANYLFEMYRLWRISGIYK